MNSKKINNFIVIIIFISMIFSISCKKNIVSENKVQDINSISSLNENDKQLNTLIISVENKESQNLIVENNYDTEKNINTLVESVLLNKFIYISGGTFVMGSPVHEQGRGGEESPQRKVTVSSFYMEQYLATQEQYEKFMGKNPSYFRGNNLPVEQVDWYNAIEYCNKRSQSDGLTQVYTILISEGIRTVIWNKKANGYRLPTEAEWEYACRAGTITSFNTGNIINTNNANFNGSNPYDIYMSGENRKKTTPVNNFSPNRWGLYDMHGNVFEWCWDFFGIYNGLDPDDPIGVEFGNNRVLRGGAWDSSLPQLRSASRFSATPDGIKSSNIGFRLVRNEK